MAPYPPARSSASPHPSDFVLPPTGTVPRWLWIVGLLVGVGLSGLGLTLVGLSFVSTASLQALAVVIAGYGLIAMTLGIGLCVAGLRGWRGRPSRQFPVKRAWLVFLLLSIVFGAIGALLPQNLQDRPLFAPFHYAMILLPGLFLFSLVALSAGPRGAISYRRLVMLLTGGASTVLLAVPVEIAGLVASGAIGALVTLLLPGGSAQIDRLTALAQQWSIHPPTDPAELVGIVTSPMVIITLVLSLSVIAPLIEEFGKTLVMGVIGIWVRPSVLTSFVWGVACGLGFAWLEGVSNGAIGIGGTAGWLGSVGVRFFATGMHCMASGLLGVGWGAFWRGRRWALPLAYVGAVAFHGFWNLNVILSLGGLAWSTTNATLGGLAMTLGVFFESTLILVSLSALIGIPLTLRRFAAPAGGA